MPEPLLPTHLYNAFTDVPHIDTDQQLWVLRLLCALLPAEHIEVLRTILGLLNDIAVRAHDPDSSQMDSHNLAVVIAPNILRAVCCRRCLCVCVCLCEGELTFALAQVTHSLTRSRASLHAAAARKRRCVAQTTWAIAKH